jgi:ATPase subunit of ABC transporter with duplicated ATPase domains
MISVSNLAKWYGDRTLFAGATFLLNSGERYGLVSGHVDASDGTVSIPKQTQLGVLVQDHFLYEDQPILGVALMGNQELWEAMAEKEKLLARPEDEFDGDLFSELEETVQRHDGYTAEARAAAILEGLGLPAHVHHDPLSTLSGGFKLRVLLAQVLASAPDVLLLDEPTNHLDILSIRWLEKFLRDFKGPVVVISHDHRFLDNISTSILDVDYETVTQYGGNYTTFLQAKQSERSRREKEIASREREIGHHQKFVDRFRAKASKARQAQSKLRMIEKKSEGLQALPGSSRRYPKFDFDQVRPSGKEVLRIKGVKKAFADNEVLHGVDLEVRRGDRLAIMGPNGIGKSTLLKIVMEELEADAGEVVWGYETYPGYFAQDHRESLEGVNRAAEEWLWDFCPGKDRGYVRGRMGLMLFSGDDGKKPLSALSGGEAARLVFSRLSVERPNVLVLDEPTNHLDLESIEALVKGLREYPGTVVFVSHDRWFVGELATRVVEIKPDAITDYLGTYEEYVHFCGDDHLDADAVLLKTRKEKRKAKKGREPRRDGREKREGKSPDSAQLRKRLDERLTEITARIEECESRIGEIDQTFCEPGYHERTPPEEVAALTEERNALQGEMDALLAEWERVETEMEG